MSLNLNIALIIDDADVHRIDTYMEAVGWRAKDEDGGIRGILLKHLQPIVASERAFLGPHSKSGALEESLEARPGSGDRDGTVSVFSAPTAKTSTLKATWGQGRAQQKTWFGKIPKGKRGRTKVFYSIPLHQGHRLVSHGVVVGDVDPVPFASQAVDSMGDAAMEAAADEILNYIVGV